MVVIALLKRLVRNDESGVATVELALIAALFMVAAIPVIDMASGIHSNIKLTTSMRSGIYYAYRKPTDTTGIETALRQASNLQANYLTVTNTQTCLCGDEQVACTTTCTTGMATYLNLTARYRLGLAMYYPSYGDEYTITKTAAVRIN